MPLATRAKGVFYHICIEQLHRVVYNISMTDWVDESTGEGLSAYTPKHDLDELLKNHID